jgi:endonuclease-3
VGRKTANVVLNVAFGELTIAVDTHVFRVSNRTGSRPARIPLEVETKLMKVVPQSHLRNAHHYLILHGRYTCVAQKPLCWKCPVYEQCGFRRRRSSRRWTLDPAGRRSCRRRNPGRPVPRRSQAGKR